MRIGSVANKADIRSLMLNDIVYLSLPIVDRSVPKSGREMLDFARRLKIFIDEGKNLVIHCRQGIGRSAVMAVAIFALRGMP
jgi:protein-tyrosine phosphatase